MQSVLPIDGHDAGSSHHRPLTRIFFSNNITIGQGKGISFGGKLVSKSRSHDAAIIWTGHNLRGTNYLLIYIKPHIC